MNKLSGLSDRLERSGQSTESDPKEHALQDSQWFPLECLLLTDIPEPVEKVCNLPYRGLDVLFTCTQVLENSGHDRTDCCSANVFGRFLIALPYAFLNKGSEIEIITRSCAILFATCPFRPLLGDICCVSVI